MSEKKPKGNTPPNHFRLGAETVAMLEDLVKAAVDPAATRTSVVRVLIAEAHARLQKREAKR
jgi:hypothetical protein